VPPDEWEYGTMWKAQQAKEEMEKKQKEEAAKQAAEEDN